MLNITNNENISKSQSSAINFIQNLYNESTEEYSEYKHNMEIEKEGDKLFVRLSMEMSNGFLLDWCCFFVGKNGGAYYYTSGRASKIRFKMYYASTFQSLMYRARRRK